MKHVVFIKSRKKRKSRNGDSIAHWNSQREAPTELSQDDSSWCQGLDPDPCIKTRISLSSHFFRANGYLLKEDAETELFEAIAKISYGRFYVSPQLSDCLVSTWAQVRRGDLKPSG
ncbi:MAG: hypothetical protein ACM34I_04725 [bacterium]